MTDMTRTVTAKLIFSSLLRCLQQVSAATTSQTATVAPTATVVGTVALTVELMVGCMYDTNL